MAAVLSRSRRSTAGKRLATLIGQAANDDDAFWSHDIWKEGGGGFSKGRANSKHADSDDGSTSSSDDSESDGEASYHFSDEDASAAIDQFDSDFNESESSSDEEDAEAQLLKEERKEKHASKLASQRVGQAAIVRKKGKGAVIGKRVLGEGWNAGLVLNWFRAEDGRPSSSAAIVSTAGGSSLSGPFNVAAAPSAALSAQSSILAPFTKANVACTAPAMPATTTAPLPSADHQSASASKAIATPMQSAHPTTQPTQAPPSTTPIVKHTKVLSRNLRVGTLSKTIKTVEQSALSSQTAKQQPESSKQSLSKGKRQYTQEEMILEAIQNTEVENNKWLLGRKRRKEAMEDEFNKNRLVSGGNVVLERFYSRRGGCNIISFMNDERLPNILTAQHQIQHHPLTVRSPKQRKQSNSENLKTKPKSITKCIITGKEARYKDPKTNLPYHNLEAYKELKRRFKDEPLVSKSKSKPERTMLATFSSSSKNIKVAVIQNGSPVSPPKIKTKPKIRSEFPTKKVPLLPEVALSTTVMPEVSSAANVKLTDSKVMRKADSMANITIPTMNNVAISTSDFNNLPFHLSRKSPRTPKPSAKVIADASSSNHLATQSHTPPNENNVQRHHKLDPPIQMEMNLTQCSDLNARNNTHRSGNT